jgi:23S rRNA pseudouridine1911/1915/1917 synthase
MSTTLASLDILYEDNHLIVVNKRVGDLVQGDQTGDAPLPDLIKSYLKEKYNKPGEVYLGVVHRLDRPTSGAVIFAKTSKALARMNQLFVEKKVNKTYWAAVQSQPEIPSGTLIHWLVKNPKNNKSAVYNTTHGEAKRAVLHYHIMQSFDHYSILSVTLETGRHHQIRAQLAAIGSPIKGDLKYGFDRSNPNGGIHLHARQLEFVHPVTKIPISIEAPLPKDPIWDLCH